MRFKWQQRSAAILLAAVMAASNAFCLPVLAEGDAAPADPTALAETDEGEGGAPAGTPAAETPSAGEESVPEEETATPGLPDEPDAPETEPGQETAPQEALTPTAVPTATVSPDSAPEQPASEAEETPAPEEETVPTPVADETNAAEEPASPWDGPLVWSDSFEETATATSGSLATYWKNGLYPANWNDLWVSKAPSSAETTYFELTKDVVADGDYSIHFHSEDAGERLALVKIFDTIDYSKDYILRMQIRAENVTGKGFYVRGQIGASVNNLITDEKVVKGTQDWTAYELTLTDLAELGGDANRLKIELFTEYMEGDVWIDDLELVEAGAKLTLDAEQLTLAAGETRRLTAAGVPAGASVTWASSDETVATVDQNGLVTAVAGGAAEITVTGDQNHSAVCKVVVTDPAQEGEFASMREKWTERLTGNSYWDGENTSDEYRAIVQGYDEAAAEALGLFVGDSDTKLFSDLDLAFKNLGSNKSTNSDDSVDFSTAASRILSMAVAYSAKGSGYYQDADLKDKILYAMQWQAAHFYNGELPNNKMYGNWYHWWISIPQSLAGAVILMHDEMPADLLASEAAALAHFNEDPSWVYKVYGAAGQMTMTSGNLADTSLVSLLRGAACSDALAAANGTKYFDSLAGVVTSGEGIYADGSFIQHTNLAYTGGYGSTLLNGVEKLVYLTAGTDYAVESEELQPVYDWIWNGIRPLYADGAMFDMVSGRSVARPTSSDLKTGRGILAAVVLMAGSAPDETRAKLQSFAKAQLTAGAAAMGADAYYSGMNAAAMMAALSLVNDDSVTPDPNTGYSKVFGAMDKAVAHADLFALGISFASSRTGRFEYGNGENKLGWHQSDGALYLYNGDPTQYSDNYWNTVDPQRLAGITTDHSTWPIGAWGNYTGNANFNGGSAVGAYASVAMNFKNYGTSTNPNLTARKAWFVFDDEVVALGAGINGINPNRTTETIVENKKIDGENILLVDGKETAADIGDEAALTDVSWAWLEGNTDADAVGYYFPEGSSLNVLREARTGSWSNVNGAAGISTEKVTRNYLSLAVPHGESAGNKLSAWKAENYDYVLLPGKTAAEVEAYAENPDIEVLCNSTFAQAVRDNAANVTGYIFWGDAGVPVRIGDVEALKGAVTVVKNPDAHILTVGMADVHQNNDSLTFRIYGSGLAVAEGNDNVTVETDKYGAVLTVNTKNAKGATFTVTLSYRDLSEGEADELAGMRQSYADSLTGNNMTDKTDAEYRAVMDQYSAAAAEALEHLNRSAAAGSNLFDDIDVQLDWVNKGTGNTDGSANLTATTTRVKALALAYASEGCAGYYHDPALLADIQFCINYILNEFPSFLTYHDKIYANWWDWSIGMPKDLSAVGVLLYGDLDESTRAELYNALQLLVPAVDHYWGRNGTGRGQYATATAANGAEMAMLKALNGLIGNDPASLYAASDSLVDSLQYVTSGDGFYPDGSYKQHGNFAYTGSYGVEMLRGVTQIASLTNNTTWACTEADPNIIYEWILNAFRPLYADGAIFDMVQGRSVSRYNRSDMTTGRYAMDAILTLCENVPDEYRDAVLSFAKTQAKLGIEYDAESYYAKLRFSSLVMAKNLLGDDTIPLDEDVYTKVYGYMDKAAVHYTNYALAISMFSSRNGATESINNENLKGWYTADGALALYNGDQNQYGDGYWATVDPLRLAGITTNHVTQPMTSANIKKNDRDWVGGSVLGVENYASIGQDFKSNYSDLEAKKSWFAFGDQIVALGAGIASTEGDTVETIVENRKIDNGNTLLIDGNNALAADDKTTETATWAWLSPNKLGGGIGYYFPEETAITALKETRTGRWSDINGANHPADDTDTVTGTYVSLAVDHGKNPTDAGYSYVLLPGKTAEETAAYAAGNGIAVLANTETVQAAADTGLGVYGFNFWAKGEVAVKTGGALDTVSADAPASVTLAEADGRLRLAIADPTQKGGTVTLRLEGKQITFAEADERITAQTDDGGVTLTVDVSNLHGESLTAVLGIPTEEKPQPTPSQTPSPDATPTPSETPNGGASATPAPTAPTAPTAPATGTTAEGADGSDSAPAATASPAPSAIPQTGDPAGPALTAAAAAAALALAGFAFCLWHRRRRHRN